MSKKTKGTVCWTDEIEAWRDDDGIPSLFINSTAISWPIYYGMPYFKYKYTQGTWFEPFTCSCGIAGCAGIFDSIKIRKRRHSVEWVVPKGVGYENIKGLHLGVVYRFDRKQYDKVEAQVNAWCDGYQAKTREGRNEYYVEDVE